MNKVVYNIWVTLLLIISCTAAKNWCLRHDFACHCNDNFTEADCSNRHDKHMYRLPDSIQRITYERNKIKNLEAYDLENLKDLKYLNMYRNQIKIVPPNVLDNNTNLSILNLSSNYLQMIDSQAFIKLKCLLILDLSQNKFQSFPNAALENTPSLQLLNLSHNKIKTLNFNTTSINYFLPNVETLDLSSNALTEIKIGGAMMAMTNLKQLSLAGNKLGGINDDAFKPLYNISLLELDLSDCFITHVNRYAFNGLNFLQTLILNKNRQLHKTLKEFFAAINPVPITTLMLKSIGLTNKNFNDIHFELLANTTIQQLDLSYNLIGTINLPIFEALFNLKYLFMSHCDIYSLSENAFQGLYSLQVLNLDFNHLFDEQFCLHRDLQNLTDLELSSNYLLKIRRNTFPQLNNLKILHLNYNAIVLIENYAFKKLTSLECLYLANQKKSSRIRFDHFAFKHAKIEILDIGRNSIKNLMSDTFSGLPSLKSLYLNQNKLGFYLKTKRYKYFFRNLRNLEFLTLRDNSISKLDDNIFYNLTKITRINLSENRIKTWNFKLFEHLKSLKQLDLNLNQIEMIDIKLLEQLPPMDFLDLSENPYLCNCDLPSFQSWLNTTNITVMKLNDPTKYWCGNHTPIFSYKPSYDDCVDPFFKFIKILSISISLSVLSLTAFLIVVYRYQWNIKFFYYKFIFSIKKANNSIVCPFVYDAFVSYCSDDKWVQDILAPTLEKDKNYRLCLHERDFLPGSYIAENIVAKMDESHIILLIISKNYLKSTWCCWEMKMSACLKDVVLVLFENVPAKKMPRSLRGLIRIHTYLEWTENPVGQKVFWDKLVQQLEKPIREVNETTPLLEDTR